MEILLSLLFKFAPYLIAGIGAIAIYFGVKRKGVNEERARQAEKQEKAKAELREQLNSAELQDSKIEAQVKEKINAVEKNRKSDPDGGDIFNF